MSLSISFFISLASNVLHHNFLIKKYAKSIRRKSRKKMVLILSLNRNMQMTMYNIFRSDRPYVVEENRERKRDK